jgi:hypothetical protein
MNFINRQRGQRRQLRRIGTSLTRSDPHLDAMFSIFGRLYPEQDLPDWEQEPPQPGAPRRIGRAIGGRRGRGQAHPAKREGTRSDWEADAQ